MLLHLGVFDEGVVFVRSICVLSKLSHFSEWLQMRGDYVERAHADGGDAKSDKSQINYARPLRHHYL